MAEFSQFWTTNGTGDGLVGGYTRDDWIEFYQTLFIPELQATVGVLPRSGNKLAVSGTANNNIQVATGRAIVYGFLYKNTSALSVPALTVPLLGTTGFRIVLRAGWAAQTARVAVLMSADGVGAIPAVTQTAGTTWEVSLATGTITTGNVVTLTDTRAYAKYNTIVGGDQFDSTVVDGVTLELASSTLRVKDSGITAAKIAAAVAGNGLAGGAGTALSVNVDSSTIEINADTLRVKDLGITLAKLAADSVDDTKAGNRVLRLDRRQGGDPTNWSAVGTTNYTPTGVRTQCGIVASAAGAASVVTFGVAYSAAPLVVAATNANAYAVVVSTAAGTCAVEARDATGARVAGVNITWVAFGPE